MAGDVMENTIGKGFTVERFRAKTLLAASISVCLLGVAGCQTLPVSSEPIIEEGDAEGSTQPMELVVSTTANSGDGSLRQALLDANANPGPDSIRFDNEGGVFGPPTSIVLESPLPEITDDLSIDGYLEGFLWRAAGITLDGNGTHRILTIAPGVSAEVRNLTLANGSSSKGGAILNRGSLIVSGVTLQGNVASFSGGAIRNDKGTVQLINSTLVRNSAGRNGGGVFNNRGSVVVTNCTFTENQARKGGALYDTGTLLLRNSILANSESKQDCASTGQGDPLSTHNIVEVNDGCPGVLHEADPALDQLNYFNGMTQTIALGMRSLALNAGSNEAALDENGEPLRWDQRGNGDPRFVAGYTDIGAFETQAYPKLVVDTVEDNAQRGCGGSDGDCPLRAAIRLANASQRAETITFAPHVFGDVRELILMEPLPVPRADVVIDGSDLGEIRVRVLDDRPVFEGALPDSGQVRGLVFE